MASSSHQQPRTLNAVPIAVDSDISRAIQAWTYPDAPFYVQQFRQMLLVDIPHLALFEDCAIWGYVDPAMGSDLVGFGTIHVSSNYARFTGGLPHCYIPLLALKPGIKSHGYGQSIVEHLVAEAAVHVPLWPGKISDRVFLDVYTSNDKACRLYQEKCLFVTLNPDDPILDPDQNNEPYVVMARSVRLADQPKKTTSA